MPTAQDYSSALTALNTADQAVQAKLKSQQDTIAQLQNTVANLQAQIKQMTDAQVQSDALADDAITQIKSVTNDLNPA
jgi:cell division protein FtsB